MKKIIITLEIVAVILIATLCFIRFAPRAEAPGIIIKEAEAAKPTLTHRQEVWLYVLEWCESRGVTSAVNKKDRDGTPSYYSFQFKPGTFKGYGELYGVIPKDLTYSQILEEMKSYELQRKIVTEMILHRDDINWNQQFPDCVKKYGKPPSMLQ